MNEFEELINSEQFYKEGYINLMIFPSCPIKVATNEALTAYVNDYNEHHQMKIHYPMGETMDYKNYMDALEHVKDYKRYPDVLVQCDIRGLFASNFIKFRENSLFVDIFKDREQHSLYETFYEKDPKGTYTLLGASFPVIAVDTSALGELPIPKSFKDLLDPIYNKKVAIHGHGHFSCDMSVMMNIFHLYGKEAMVQFSKSIHSLRHFSQVVKEIGRGHEDLPPICVIPETFGSLAGKRKGVEIVWPQDGSPVFPLWMTVKKEKLEMAQELLDFLTGEKLGSLWSASGFASVNPNVKNQDYHGKPLNFMGWDNIYDDIYEKKKAFEEEVMTIIRGYKMDESEKPRLIC